MSKRKKAEGNGAACLAGDGNPVKSRGLCLSHYNSFRALKNKEAVDEEKLIKAGKILASQKGQYKAFFVE